MYRQSLLVFLVIATSFHIYAKKDVILLTEDNWPDMLEGEWLVKFYAPWCPACRALEEPWKEVATWQEDFNFHVAEIDVTENPSLSGRFLVTALPTIYHVKDGEFRLYKGDRKADPLVAFIDEKGWQKLAPVPWYSNPNSPHMSAVGLFFKLSLSIRDLHNRMTTEFGIPIWGSYVIFAIITIVFGLFLGLCCVCLCDCCCPQPAPVIREREPLRYSRAAGLGASSKDDEDDDSDTIHDDRPKKAAEEPSSTSGEAKSSGARKRTVKKE